MEVLGNIRGFTIKNPFGVIIFTQNHTQRETHVSLICMHHPMPWLWTGLPAFEAQGALVGGMSHTGTAREGCTRAVPTSFDK